MKTAPQPVDVDGDEFGLRELLRGLRSKTKAAMEDGPEGQDIVLTPAEATLVFRSIFEME